MEKVVGGYPIIAIARVVHGWRTWLLLLTGEVHLPREAALDGVETVNRRRALLHTSRFDL